MKTLIALLMLVLTSPSAFAKSMCLNEKETVEYLELLHEYETAKKEDPACEKRWGAAACVSPFANQIRRIYAQRIVVCAGENSPNAIPDGKWVIADRRCSDGKRADDAFKFGRDFARLTVRDGLVNFEFEIDGKKHATRAVVSNRQKRIFYVGDDGIEAIDFRLTEMGDLEVISGGFGEGGSCAIGTTLKTYLQRQID